MESRNVVPLRSEFKPPPILLSRKGPIVVSSSPRPPPTQDLSKLSLKDTESSDDDEDETKTRQLSLAERQAQAAKEREERQRKYDERRLELFGPTASAGAAGPANSNLASNRSGASTPASLTPPGSRSATPNRGGGGRGKGARGRGGGGAGGGGGGPSTATSSGSLRTQTQAPRTSHHQQTRELFDPSYVPRPDVQRRENGAVSSSSADMVQPIRAPRGPDGSGRGGFGFAHHSHARFS